MLNKAEMADDAIRWLDKVTAGQWRDSIGRKSFFEILGDTESYVFAMGKIEADSTNCGTCMERPF